MSKAIKFALILFVLSAWFLVGSDTRACNPQVAYSAPMTYGGCGGASYASFQAPAPCQQASYGAAYYGAPVNYGAPFLAPAPVYNYGGVGLGLYGATYLAARGYGAGYYNANFQFNAPFYGAGVSGFHGVAVHAVHAGNVNVARGFRFR